MRTRSLSGFQVAGNAMPRRKRRRIPHIWGSLPTPPVPEAPMEVTEHRLLKHLPLLPVQKWLFTCSPISVGRPAYRWFESRKEGQVRPSSKSACLRPWTDE